MKESVGGVGFSNNNKNTTLFVPNSNTILIKEDVLTRRVQAVPNNQTSPFTAKSNLIFFSIYSISFLSTTNTCIMSHKPYDNRYLLHNRKYHRQCKLLNIFLSQIATLKGTLAIFFARFAIFAIFPRTALRRRWHHDISLKRM